MAKGIDKEKLYSNLRKPKSTGQEEIKAAVDASEIDSDSEAEQIVTNDTKKQEKIPRRRPEKYETKSARLNVIIKPSELDAFKKLCKKEGWHMNEAINLFIQDAIKRGSI